MSVRGQEEMGTTKTMMIFQLSMTCQSLLTRSKLTTRALGRAFPSASAL